ncbi:MULTISPECIES: hypothetical protein [unclassified Cellvibrio]|uniref:hypothetical protein n=1 Tax=unclassified Cellvibrio TaxID=2624793 RepID=UPI001780196E|nr:MULTISPECIES: hypothetical protein [unclassified Cellvibrio]UUA74273.1 hypothetical protein NNX04_07480 [Cellvibrio sp. QJXJ]
MELGVVIGILVILLVALFFKLLPAKRNKEPTLFNCARCGGQSVHTERTLTAWRNNKKPYCNDCHKRWLESNAGKPVFRHKNNAGCLGFVLVLILIPSSYFIVQVIYPG